MSLGAACLYSRSLRQASDLYPYLVIVVFRKTLMLTRNVIDPGYSSISVAKVQANSKTPASLVRSYRGADAISLQNYVTYALEGTFS